MRVTANKAARAELAELASKNGRLTEDLILKASRSKRSALHSLLLWDNDEEAARIGRREIARQLIVSVTIEKAEAQELNCSVDLRKYHGEVGGGYYDIREILTQDRLRGMLLDNALRDLEALRARYKMLKELVPLFRVVDAIRSKSRRRKAA